MRLPRTSSEILTGLVFLLAGALGVMLYLQTDAADAEAICEPVAGAGAGPMTAWEIAIRWVQLYRPNSPHFYPPFPVSVRNAQFISHPLDFHSVGVFVNVRAAGVRPR
ncbi:exported hypothetical protein [Mesorhizobium plurifarium]|uniref:Uncharacterized protein n=1 Tax=Mesorhizobium plurifarium TaxID=69974 RepID=A0A090G5L5_MESPL|nr:exported hypothetical protein [Mesorhizobium plurifarium]